MMIIMILISLNMNDTILILFKETKQMKRARRKTVPVSLVSSQQQNRVSAFARVPKQNTDAHSQDPLPVMENTSMLLWGEWRTGQHCSDKDNGLRGFGLVYDNSNHYSLTRATSSSLPTLPNKPCYPCLFHRESLSLTLYLPDSPLLSLSVSQHLKSLFCPTFHFTIRVTRGFCFTFSYSSSPS